MSDGDTARGPKRIEEPTRAERAIARRAAEARATVPDLELSTNVDVTGLGEPASSTACVVKACAQALREHPRANGAYRDGHFELYSRVNIGVTVTSADSYAVPTVFDADSKTVNEIAETLQHLEARALAGELTQPELSGATFVITPFDSFGIGRVSAILTPSHAATLAIGAPNSVPMVRDGAIVPGVQITMTLISDHRILYGAPAARFLARIAELVQSP